MISRTKPTNILPQRSRLWTKPIQDKLCHLFFNQPYQETTTSLLNLPTLLTNTMNRVRNDQFIFQHIQTK